MTFRTISSRRYVLSFSPQIIITTLQLILIACERSHVLQRLQFPQATFHDPLGCILGPLSPSLTQSISAVGIPISSTFEAETRDWTVPDSSI